MFTVDVWGVKTYRWLKWRLQKPMPNFADRSQWSRELENWKRKRP
jgi:hypothetical protein